MYAGMLRSRLLDQRLLAAAAAGPHRLLHRRHRPGGGHHRRRPAIGPEDWFVPGLREAGAALYRGLPLRTHLAQIFGNANDLDQGPADALPLGLARQPLRRDVLVRVDPDAARDRHRHGRADQGRQGGGARLLGDGGTSEDDFHVGAQLRRRVQGAGGVRLPEQPVGDLDAAGAADGVGDHRASRAWPTACPRCGSTATTCSRCTSPSSRRSTGRAPAAAPRFIEALTYRLGAHSSSDDPTRYRDEAEPEAWRDKDPLVRFRTWLLAAGHPHRESEEAALAAELEAGDPRGHRRRGGGCARRRCHR